MMMPNTLDSPENGPARQIGGEKKRESAVCVISTGICQALGLDRKFGAQSRQISPKICPDTPGMRKRGESRD